MRAKLELHHHSDRVFTIEHFLSAAECASLIAIAESTGFETATVRTASGPKLMASVRNNERTMVHHPVWRDEIWTRLASVGLPHLGGLGAVGLPQDLRFYKYSAGEQFRMHKDGPWEELGRSSKLSFLVYLNAEFEGGRTDFRDFVIQPTQGMALLFIHDTWHAGEKVTSGTKYVLRSDVLYGAQP